jgi:hypothetical protein
MGAEGLELVSVKAGGEEHLEVARAHRNVSQHVRRVACDDAHHARRHFLLTAERVGKQDGRAIKGLGLYRHEVVDLPSTLSNQNTFSGDQRSRPVPT